MLLTTNFHRKEFNCKDGRPVSDQYLYNVQTMATQLQKLRDHIGESIQINFGYRTASYKKSVSGSPKSQHLTASAVDIQLEAQDSNELAAII